MRIPRPDRRALTGDLAGGLTVAMVSIPEGMAFALIAGVDPIYGLYAGMLTVIIGSLLASSRLMIITLTNAVSLVVADSLGLLGDDIARGIATLTLLVGLVQLLLGVMRMGSLIRFVSSEVMTGFIAAVATIIILGQLDHLTGYTSTIGDGSFLTGRMISGIDTLLHPGLWDIPTAAVGLGTVLVLLLLKRTRLARFAGFLVIVVITGFTALVGWGSIELVRDISDIPSSLPALVTPDPGLVPGLVPAAIAIALVALIESASISVTYTNPDGKRADMSRNFTAHGLANLVGGLIAALPGGGSMSRTAINVEGGSRTRWGGMYAGAILIAAMLLAGDLFEMIPMAALAGLLIVIAVGILLREWPKAVEAWRTSRAYSLAMVATYILGVAVSLEVAVFVGVVLSLGLYIYHASSDLRLVELVPLGDGRFEERPVPSEYPSGEATVVQANGHMYFAAVYSLDDDLPSHDGTRHAVVVLSMHGRHFISMTFIDWMVRYSRELEDAGNRFMLSDVAETIIGQLERTGVLEVIGSENVFLADPVIGASTEEALSSARRWLAGEGQPGGEPDGGGG